MLPLTAVEWVAPEHCPACPCGQHAAHFFPPELLLLGEGSSAAAPPRARSLTARLSSLAGSVFLLASAGGIGAMTWVAVDAHARSVQAQRAATAAADAPAPAPHAPRQGGDGTVPAALRWSSSPPPWPLGPALQPAFDPAAHGAASSALPTSWGPRHATDPQAPLDLLGYGALSSRQRGMPGPTHAALPVALARLGPDTHEPDELLARAERLAGAGGDLSVGTARVSAPMMRRWSEGAVEPPDMALDGRTGVRGLRMQGIRADSVLAAVGLQNGDLVTALNGYALASPARLEVAYEAAQAKGKAVVELDRGGRSVVLLVSWPRT